MARPVGLRHGSRSGAAADQPVSSSWITSSITARAASRRRTISRQSLATGTSGSAERHLDAARPNQQRAGRKDAARAADGDRDDRAAGVHRGPERAEPERQQPPGLGERAFGEYEQRPAFAQRRDDGRGVVDALRVVTPVEPDVSCLADGRADQRIAHEPSLDREADVGGQGCHDYDRVQKTDVVGHVDRRPRP